MIKPKRYFFICKTHLLFLFFFLLGNVVFAGPTIIQDNRITDLATTPVLGRGYSIATNTYQSVCLSGAKITEPSYDFTYEFLSLKKTDVESLHSKIDMKSFSSSYRNQLLSKLVPTGEAQFKSEQSIFSHHILVVINLHSYYASLDESLSKMSSSASKLLTRDDIPGFFASCGSYYVRSIGRTAKFIAMFTYQTIEDKRDLEFEKELESQISGFGRDTNGSSNQTSDSENSRVTWQFKKRAESKKLIINVAAFGLGKNKKATLISYDIVTFKKALKDAFLSMQNPRTGKVTSIEVVPWVENTDFQALIKLEGQTRQRGDKKKKKKLFLYEKKKILNLNAEFLAEIERMDRSMLNLYYKAKICKQYINENYKTLGNIKTQFKRKKLLHLKGGKSFSLLKLDQYLNPDKILLFLEREENFMHGGKDVFNNKDWGKGAKECIKQIMSKGIYQVVYREIPQCGIIVKNMGTVDDEIIDNYCMPVLARE